MTVNVAWDSEIEDVIVYQFLHKWTWDEFLLAFNEECLMAKAIGNRQYDVIGDTSQGATLPIGAGITHIYSVYKRYPKNWGITMIVTQNGFLRTMHKIGARVHPDAKNAFVVVSTLEEARNAIRERRTETITQTIR